MQGDGKTSYDLAKDGVPNMIGQCTVREALYGASFRFPTNSVGKLSRQQHRDKTQGHLCQGLDIGCTSIRAFLIPTSCSVRPYR